MEEGGSRTDTILKEKRRNENRKNEHKEKKKDQKKG